MRAKASDTVRRLTGFMMFTLLKMGGEAEARPGLVNITFAGTGITREVETDIDLSAAGNADLLADARAYMAKNPAITHNPFVPPELNENGDAFAECDRTLQVGIRNKLECDEDGSCDNIFSRTVWCALVPGRFIDEAAQLVKSKIPVAEMPSLLQKAEWSVLPDTDNDPCNDDLPLVPVYDDIAEGVFRFFSFENRKRVMRQAFPDNNKMAFFMWQQSGCREDVRSGSPYAVIVQQLVNTGSQLHPALEKLRLAKPSLPEKETEKSGQKPIKVKSVKNASPSIRSAPRR